MGLFDIPEITVGQDVHISMGGEEMEQAAKTHIKLGPAKVTVILDETIPANEIHMGPYIIKVEERE